MFPKIDTQGYERPVLEGAREVLSKAVGVQLELPLVHLYECTGHWPTTRVIEHCGFCAGATQASRLPKNGPVSMIELDGNLAAAVRKVSGSGSPSLSHFRFATNRDYARPRLGVNTP